MCGIAGFVTKERFSEFAGELDKAVSLLAHRGPDDAGLHLDEKNGVGLGHRRLSIIDLSPAGHQPMATADGRMWITYNGEVYNFAQIRKVLEGKGHRFRSGTDTEVLLAAYRQWGMNAFSRLVGMFAAAIWDVEKNRLVLVRDRLGLKPLYYGWCGKAFVFASELKSLAAFSAFSRTVDPDALAQYFHFQYVPAPKTIFADAKKLLPGHLAVLEEGRLSTEAYWRIPDIPDPSDRPLMDETALADELDRLIVQAVKDRLVSDVPIGALLSGGIDSSMVAAAMQKANASTIKTFSIGFEEASYDEAPYAAAVARHLGTEHTRFTVTAKEALEVIPDLCTLYDEPFADSSAIPTYLVSRLARSRVTVALSGDGGDEQFCGYVRYWSTASMARAFGPVPPQVRRGLSALLAALDPHTPERLYRPLRDRLPQRLQVANFQDKWKKLIKCLGRADEPSALYRSTVCLWEQEEIRRLLGQDVFRSGFDRVFDETEGRRLISRLMRVDQHTYLPDAMLTKVDRASMAVALEVRVPLLDHRIVEFTARLDERFKYKNGTGKHLLKKVLARYVPERLFTRPKMGFGVPLDRWLREDLRPMVEDYLSPARLKQEGVLNPAAVEEKVSAHMSGKISHKDCLWAALMWEMWREKWLI